MKRSLALVILAIAIAGCSNSSNAGAPLVPSAPQLRNASKTPHGKTQFSLNLIGVPLTLRSVSVFDTSPNYFAGKSSYVNINAATSSACKTVSGKRQCSVVVDTYVGWNHISVSGYTKSNQGGKDLFDLETPGTAKKGVTNQLDVPVGLFVADFFMKDLEGRGSMTNGPVGDSHVYTLTQNNTAQFITSATQSGSIVNHPQPLPSPGAFDGYNSIAAGSNLTLWMTDGSFETPEGIVSMRAPTGTIHYYPATKEAACIDQNVPVSIGNGFDGNAWFMEFTCLDVGGGGIGVITPGGAITNHYLPEFMGSQIYTFTVDLHQIVIGPDNAEYFFAMTCLPSGSACNGSYHTITRMTSGGAITVHRLNEAQIGNSCACAYITVGGDKNIWVMIPSAPPGGWAMNTLVRLTPAGAITYYHTGFNLINDLGTGPDGNLYFTDQGGVGRFRIMDAPFGQYTYYKPQGCTSTTSVSSGPGGFLYVAGADVNSCQGSDIKKMQVP